MEQGQPAPRLPARARPRPQANTVAQQALSNIRTVYAFNGEERTVQAYGGMLDHPMKAGGGGRCMAQAERRAVRSRGVPRTRTTTAVNNIAPAVAATALAPQGARARPHPPARGSAPGGPCRPRRWASARASLAASSWASPTASPTAPMVRPATGRPHLACSTLSPGARLPPALPAADPGASPESTPPLHCLRPAPTPLRSAGAVVRLHAHHRRRLHRRRRGQRAVCRWAWQRRLVQWGARG